jgi:hypothetical protein
MEVGLYAIAPCARLIAKPIGDVAPGVAKRLNALERRARERTLDQVAEAIMIRLLRRPT